MIYTKRLLLRKFKLEDVDDLYEYLSNPEVVQFEPYDAMNRAQCQEIVEMRTKEHEAFFWAVCIKEKNKLIGNIYFAPSGSPELKTFEVGYVFNPDYQGKGYATEAVKAIFEYAFETLKAHRIVAGTNVLNEKSWRLLERLGMRREAHFIKNIFFKRTADGQPIWNDSYRYAILADEYYSRKGS